MCFVCFQAEDGIRDLVRSRGLGDVYKRQTQGRWAGRNMTKDQLRQEIWAALEARKFAIGPASVSYTHLTLPTSDLV